MIFRVVLFFFNCFFFVFGGGFSREFFEVQNKGLNGFIPYGRGDKGDGIIGVFNQGFCQPNTGEVNVIVDGIFQIFVE